jgi:hypothetical protein
MLKVLVTLCLTADPNICKEVRQSYPEVEMTWYSCFMATQTDMAKILADNPRWFLKRWQCTNGQFQEKA